MGTVFEAEDEVLGRRVAIKRLKSGDESGRRRFWREARAAARLSHPNVCPLYEVGEDASGPFLAMELLLGEPLSERLRRGADGRRARSSSLGAGMLAALQALHAAGLVHRDLKPSNVYLTAARRRGCSTSAWFARCAARLAAAATPRASPRQRAIAHRFPAPDRLAALHGAGADPRPGRGRAAPTSSPPAPCSTRPSRAARPSRAHRSSRSSTATLHDAPPPLGDAARALDAVRPAGARQGPRRALRLGAGDGRSAARGGVAAARLRAASGSTGARRPGAGEVFAGRRAELAWLEERLAAALSGRGRRRFVTGERGTARRRSSASCCGACAARAAPSPSPPAAAWSARARARRFQPFLDAIGRLFGSSRGREQAVELVKTWAPTVGVLMPAALVPDPDGSLHRQTAGATRERLIRESGDFMEAATRLYPVVMLLEDLQWADPDERRPAVPPRAPQRAPAHPDPLHLPRLGGRGAEPRAAPRHARPAHGRAGPRARARAARRRRRRAWLDARFPPTTSPPRLAAAAARPRRGPAALRPQPGRAARRARRDPSAHAGGFRLARPLAALDLEPSKDVKDLVRAHLATLPAADRELLAAASVLGKEFSSAVARALAGGDELDVEERLQRLSRVHRVLENLGEEDLPGRHARHPLPLRPRPLPARPLRGPGRPAPGRAPPARRRAAAALLGRGRPHAGGRVGRALRARPRLRARRPLPHARRASTRPAASPAPRPSSTTRCALALVDKLPSAGAAAARGRAPRPARRGAARCRRASTTPPATTRPCSSARAPPGSRPPSARRSAASATRTSSSSACPR